MLSLRSLIVSSIIAVAGLSAAPLSTASAAAGSIAKPTPAQIVQKATDELAKIADHRMKAMDKMTDNGVARINNLDQQNAPPRLLRDSAAASRTALDHSTAEGLSNVEKTRVASIALLNRNGGTSADKDAVNAAAKSTASQLTDCRAKDVGEVNAALAAALGN